MRVRFNRFVLDTDRRELWSGSELVHLTPKAFRLLQILVESRSKAVSQQELYDLLWPRTVVEMSNLHNLVYQLRQALDDREQDIIRTVYGFGFSFAAAAAEDTLRLSVWQIVVGDVEFDLFDGDNIVGRQKDVAVRIDDGSISRHHARLIVSARGVSVEDLDSENGTSVHGRPIHALTPLVDGDRIVFGTVAATLRADHGSRSTRTAH